MNKGGRARDAADGISSGGASAETDIQSFVVRIWLEETAAEAGRVTWRGHITQVPSGERRYLKDLDGVTAFIATYLRRMGVQIGPLPRVRRWLGRRRR